MVSVARSRSGIRGGSCFASTFAPATAKVSNLPHLGLGSLASELTFYFEGSGFSPRRIVFCFETASGPGEVELVIILKRPGCVTACPCSRALTTLLGMDAMAPVEPDVPWAAAKSVETSKEAMTKAECINVDFI